MSGDAKAGPTFDVFLSIATEDEAAGRRFEAFLEQHGLRTFLAVSDLGAVVGTQQWSEALEGVLARCPVLVLLASRQALESKWVSFEWRSFHDDVLSSLRAGLLVPVLIEELAIETLPAALRHWQMVTHAHADEAKAQSELLHIITGFRRATQSSEAPLERQLRWSLEPLSRAAPPTEASTPTRASRSRPWGALGLAGAVALGALGTAAWTRQSPAPPDPVKRGASSSARPEPPALPLQPPEVWTLLEQLGSPTPRDGVRLMRSETWNEAQSALERYCHAASLAPRDAARERLGGGRCTNRHLAALELVKGERAYLAGELASAQASFTLAKRLDQKWALPPLALARALTSSNPAQAREQARVAYELDGSLWLALSVKANTFIEERRYPDAILELGEAQRKASPESRPLVQAALALAYHSEGAQENKATELAKPLCTSNLHVVAACTVLGEQALEAGKPDEALRVYELAERNDFVPLELVQGDAYQLRKQLPRAWAAWRRAVSLAGRADQEGTPKERMAAIVQAVRTNVEPPPRGAPDRARPSSLVRPAPRSRPANAGSGVSRDVVRGL